LTGTGVVINEFRLLGLPDYGDQRDQYLELRNDSAAPVDIGGWRIVTQSSGGKLRQLKVLSAGITLGPGCHYLVATVASSLKIAVDDRWEVNQTGILPWNEGGMALQQPDGSIVDQVGWGSVPSFFEGVALAKPGTFEAGNFTRIGNDTNNNRADFVDAKSISPQNSSSSCSIR
jgi:hypothetical protein